MSDERLSRLEGRFEELERRFSALESRLTTAPDISEATSGHSQADDTDIQRAVEAPDESAPVIDQPDDGPPVIFLLGRLFLFLAVAFVLRAATDSGALPASLGVALGIAYGAVQLYLAERAARNMVMTRSATWLGLGSALVVFPLLFEATHEFQILRPEVSALLLPAMCLSGVYVATRHDLRAMAWIFMAFAGSVSLLLSGHSGFAIEFPLAVLLIGIGGLWLGYWKGWYGLALLGSIIPVVLTAVVTLLLVTGDGGSLAGNLTAKGAMVLQLALVTGYLGSYFAHALWAESPVGMTEIMQSFFALAVGIGGVLVSGQQEPGLFAIIGPVILSSGLLCYVAAFYFIDWKGGHRVDFAFFTTVAMVSTLVGSSLLLDGVVQVEAFLVAALGMAVAGWRFRRATLSLHAAIYIIGAGVSSGLVGLAIDGLTGEMALPPDSGPLTQMVGVILIAIICCGIPVVHQGRTWGKLSRMSKALYLFHLVIVLSGLVVIYMSRALAFDGDEFDVGKVAALRTSVLGVSAILLGVLARYRKLREGALLIPVILVFGGLALVLGDFRSGRPSTQFLSLGVYGASLILASRSARNIKKAAEARRAAAEAEAAAS